MVRCLKKVPQSEAPEAPFLIEAPFLVIINRRLAAVKICRKFHESNFENIFLVAINSHLAAVEIYRKNSRRF